MTSKCARFYLLSTLLLAPLLLVGAASAQDGEALPQEQLDQLLAPVALYPDALLSQVLMASTYPVDVAAAAKWSAANRDVSGDAAVTAVADMPWDPSVQSLVAFPQALAMMGDKPDWVQQLGDAFLADPGAVMDTVQGLRKRAREQGNLESSEQQTVVVQQAEPQQTIIVVEPADPQVIYVPAYNPTIIYGTWWWPRYPPPFYWPPPPYYGYAVAAGIAFGVGIVATRALWGGCNWRGRNVNINVNRYNSINANRQINASGNNVSWNHDAKNRKGVPYAAARSREKFGGSRQGAGERSEYRGKVSDRDLSRDRAQATLQQRGADPASSRDALRNDQQTRERANQAVQGGGDRNKARADAQRRDREQAKNTATRQSRDNAFANAGNASRTNRNVDRGQRSRSNAGSAPRARQR